MVELKNITGIKLSLATEADVSNWSSGEVTKPETINYKTYKHEKGGLFDELIFGPSIDYKCAICEKKYKRISEEQFCENTEECKKKKPQILSRLSRRRRMGHIDLASPVLHFWFFKVDHSIIAKLLSLKNPINNHPYSRNELEDIIYFRSHIILETGNLKSIVKNRIININEAPIIYRAVLREILENVTDKFAIEDIKIKISELEELASSRLGKDYGIDFYELNEIIEQYSDAKIGVGAEAIEYLLSKLDIPSEIKNIETKINDISYLYKKSSVISQSKITERNKLYKKLKILNAFVNSKQSTSSLLIRKLPIIPADLRPLIQLDGGRHTTTDLNELYRRIIIRNNRLKKWIELDAPVLIIQNEKRMLQESVDALIDNKRRKPSPVLSKDNRPLKSISDALTGKRGRFRLNLLGKRVDYSGRSVIVVGPNLKMHQVGIPRQMITRLFEPFIVNQLIKNEIASSIKIAREYIDTMNPIIWPYVEVAIKGKVVLLNRAPTLHRLSIQAFEPIIIRGKAIRIHPLVTTAFNADFDGDQMAIHVPMSEEALNEAKELMMANKNILSPKDGDPIINPSQDMILGLYYISKETAEAKGEGQYFMNLNKMRRAYEAKELDLHARIAISTKGLPNKLKLSLSKDGYIVSTVGKFIFNDDLPSRFPFVFSTKHINSKTIPTEFFIPYGENIVEWIKKMPINSAFTKKDVAKIIRNIFDQYSPEITKRDLSKIVQKINSGVTNDMLGFVTKVCKSNKITITPIHALYITEFLSAEFHKIKSRIKFDNGGVDSVFEIKDRVELLDNVWFDYTNMIGDVLNNIKETGFKYSTKSGISMSIFDIIPSTTKDENVVKGEAYVQKLKKLHDTGLLTDAERYSLVINKWTEVKELVQDEIKEIIKENPDNPIFTMLNSGARSNISNIVQLAGLRGLMANASVILKANDKNNKLTKVTIEVPVKSSFLDGLTGYEFFSSTHGARKALTDVALNTANAGYLTRKLVNACQDIIIKKHDCNSDVAFKITDIIDTKTNSIISSMKERIIGRFSMHDIFDKKEKLIVPSQGLINADDAELIEKAGHKSIEIRSILGCHVYKGACIKCYGLDLTTNDLVNIGEPVGIIASQSIGEPGTQLTMRTFHTGGVAQAGGGITGGFQRLKELIDATKTPWSTPAIISEIPGTVVSIEKKVSKDKNPLINHGTITVTIERTKDEKIIDTKSYTFSDDKLLRVKKGKKIKAGSKITEGPIILHDLVKISDASTVQKYILKEIQRLYRMQGIIISDKYVEIVIRQMFSKIIISDPGDTELFAGSLVDIHEYLKINSAALDERKSPSYGNIIITGVRKIASLSDSFLDAASYQETPLILVHSALKGDVDPLAGPKENIILGKKIPLGTGIDYDINKKFDINNSESYFD